MNLETITVSQAKDLAKTPGDLILDSLKSINEDVSSALSSHSGTVPGRSAVLSLGGLQTLSVAAAKALQSHAGSLSLPGLTEISEDLAAALAGHRGSLFLKGISLLHPAAAKVLAKHSGNLGLNALTTLSADTAEALSKHGGQLSLKGLTTLTPDAAVNLAKHRGTLKLNGITSMSAEVAKSFEGYAGLKLELGGLRDFPDPVVDSFAKILTAGERDRLWVLREVQDRIGEKLLANRAKAGTSNSDSGDFDAKVFAIALKELPKLSQALYYNNIKIFLKRPKNLFLGIIDAMRRGDSWETACEKLDDDEFVAALVVFSIGREVYVLSDPLSGILYFEELAVKDRECTRRYLEEFLASYVCSNMEKGIKLLKLKDKPGTKKAKKKKLE